MTLADNKASQTQMRLDAARAACSSGSTRRAPARNTSQAACLPAGARLSCKTSARSWDAARSHDRSSLLPDARKSNAAQSETRVTVAMVSTTRVQEAATWSAIFCQSGISSPRASQSIATSFQKYTETLGKNLLTGLTTRPHRRWRNSDSGSPVTRLTWAEVIILLSGIVRQRWQSVS